MLNRKIQPQIENVGFDKLLIPEKVVLPNGIPLYTLTGGDQDVVKIDFDFKAGSWFQNKALTARLTNRLISEGSKKYSSKKISDFFDSHGANFKAICFKDTALLSVTMLRKHFNAILPYLEEIIKNPVFSENEFNISIKKEKNNYIDSIERVGDVASMQFNEKVFGENNPYGKIITESDFDNLTTKDLHEFYKSHYHPQCCFIILSGKVGDEERKTISNCFGGVWNANLIFKNPEYSILQQKGGKFFIEKQQALQSAIRIGFSTINIYNDDYNKLNILATILGGYFGSRLMKNIREDKGYTYGINSSLVSLRQSGLFYISTEVGCCNCEDAVKEIHNEINKLVNVPIDIIELINVKRYLQGRYLRNFDGVFACADKLRDVIEYDLDYISVINESFNTLSNITPEEILEVANKYFKNKNFIEVIAGKK